MVIPVLIPVTLPALSSFYRDRLNWICDEEGFIEDTQSLAHHAAQAAAQSGSEAQVSEAITWLYRLRNRLEKIPPLAREYLGPLYDELVERTRYPAEKHSTRQMVRSTYSDDEIEEMGYFDNPNSRIEIGRMALELFQRYEIHAGSSETGGFVKYLQIVSDVSGRKFHAHKLAREVLDDPKPPLIEARPFTSFFR